MKVEVLSTTVVTTGNKLLVNVAPVGKAGAFVVGSTVIM